MAQLAHGCLCLKVPSSSSSAADELGPRAGAKSGLEGAGPLSPQHPVASQQVRLVPALHCPLPSTMTAAGQFFQV